MSKDTNQSIQHRRRTIPSPVLNTAAARIGEGGDRAVAGTRAGRVGSDARIGGMAGRAVWKIYVRKR